MTAEMDPDFSDDAVRKERRPQSTYAPSRASASFSPKSTPTHDHTTDQLGAEGDEYLPKEIDLSGEKKVMPNGALCGGREYRCGTFSLANRGDKLFMLATECAVVLGYRDASLFFNQNLSLREILMSQTEKDDLVRQGILPFSHRSQQVPIVTARSVFRQFGSRVIVDGRQVRDDYWETKARMQGLTESDGSGEKPPGAFNDFDATAAGIRQKVSHINDHLGRFNDRPPFTHYCRHHESDVAASYPGLGSLEISRILFKIWFEEEEEGVRSFWARHAAAALHPGLGEIFTHFVAQWWSAESFDKQLRLLMSLENHRPMPKVLPEAKCIGTRWQGWLRCEWELPSVVRELQETQSSDVRTLLESFVAITGSHGNMECVTCARFLEKEWKDSGARALEVLSHGLSLLKHFLPAKPPRSSRARHATDSHIVIRVNEQQDGDAQSLIDAIVWVCAAVRVNPRRQTVSESSSRLQASKANQLLSIDGGKSQALIYGLEPLTVCSDEDLGLQANCWIGLFTSGIVAYWPLGRPWGAGLSISFDMMVHLSGVENVFHLDGGIIFVGFTTALVPIAHDATTNSIQWHFEEVDTSSSELLKPSSLLAVLGDWYRSQDINILRTSKCFVGWFARANILLGTRQLVENPRNKLKWSTETREHHQTVRRDGFEATGQLGFTVGPINTGLQLISTWQFHSNVQRFHRHEQYSTALRLGRENVAVIIDSDSKQVWLVPMLSLVLHLCHRYFQEVDSDGHMDNPLPFADPSPDGASEAARVLEASGDVLAFGAAGDPDAENLRQLFLRINTNLLDAAATREQSNKKTLFASELMAMVIEPGRGSPLKKMKASDDVESWVGLLERVDFVGVCANIGHLIEPEPPSTSQYPCACSVLPRDEYLLAAHMRCLDSLSKREGASVLNNMNSLNKVCRLGDRVFWNVEKVYWTSCPARAHESIWNEKDRILQRISSKERGRGKNVPALDGLAVLQQNLLQDGVVVFGGEPSKRVLQSWRWSEYVF